MLAERIHGIRASRRGGWQWILTMLVLACAGVSAAGLSGCEAGVAPPDERESAVQNEPQGDSPEDDQTNLTLIDAADASADGEPVDATNVDDAADASGDDESADATQVDDAIDASDDGKLVEATEVDDAVDASGGELTEAQVIAALAALSPLPKPHYGPSVIAHLPEWRDYNREIVRITRSSGVAGAYNENWTRLAVQAAIEANEAEPDAIATVLNMYWGPWLVEYRNEPHDVTDFGEPYRKGLERMRTTLLNQRAWIERANADFGSDIELGQFFLEIELWPIPENNDPAWRAALLRRHDECYDLVKSIFPDVPIAWYNRGAVFEKSRDNGLVFFSGTRLFTGEEKGDACTTTLYRVGADQHSTLESMRRTIANVDEVYGTDVPITPFIAIGAGYRYTMGNPLVAHFYRQWDYDIVHSYKLGMFINVPVYWESNGNVLLGADWSRVPAVMFYPPLLDHKRSDRKTVHMRMKHFVAYCCGATGAPFPTHLWPYE